MAAPAIHWLLMSDPATSPPPPEIPDGVVPPNPAETFWRLGSASGAAVAPSVAAGFELVLATSLRNNGQALAFDPLDPLEAVVWRGDDAADLFFPDVAWSSAPDGTLTLAVRAGDTAGLEPGRYSLRVGVTAQGFRMLAYDGVIQIEGSPGSDAPRVPYVTGRDLTFYYDQNGTFHNDESDQAAFLRQRVDASDEFDRMLVTRYMARPGFARRRFPDYDPDLGYDRPDPTLAPPTRAQLTDWLKAGGLVVEQKAREIVARMALFLILDRQETESQNVYRQHAQEQRARAAELWAGYQAQIDADLDGIADWLIGIDATFLPAGAAP